MVVVGRALVMAWRVVVVRSRVGGEEGGGEEGDAGDDEGDD